MVIDLRIRSQLPQLTDTIVATYAGSDQIHHLGHCPLPSYEAIIEATDHLKEILYPGYRRRDRLHLGNVAYHVGDLIDKLFDTLSRQIARALCLGQRRDNQCSPSQQAEFETLAQGKTLSFLEQLPAIRSMLADDVQAAYDGDPACKSLDEVIFCYPGLEAITVHRLAHALYKLDVPFIPRMMSEWSHGKTGIDIHPGATIGRRFFIDHGTGVVIGETCEIGNDVKLYQGVTLGALSFRTDEKGELVRDTKRHPTVEDRVVVYANATVLGGKTIIGHDAVIGASTWVTRSVEPSASVILEAPKMKIRPQS